MVAEGGASLQSSTTVDRIERLESMNEMLD